MKKMFFGLLTALLLSVFFMVSCQSAESSIQFFAMDTIMELKTYGSHCDEALDAAQNAILQVEKIASAVSTDSQLAQLNQNGEAVFSQLDPQLQELLTDSLQYSRETSGAFDITLGQLSFLWGFGSSSPSVPSQEDIQLALSHSGWKNLSITQDKIVLENEIQLDLGAIAKGYAADQAAKAVQQSGCKSALLSLGGNIYAVGTNQGEPWKVGIANPKEPSNIVGYLSITDKALVTSGSYQRYFEQDGVRYHHIMNSSTGYPAETGLDSVTILSSSSTQADAYSTAVFCMGLEQGMKFINDCLGVEAVFLTTDGKIFLTSGIQQSFTWSEQADYKLEDAE